MTVVFFFSSFKRPNCQFPKFPPLFDGCSFFFAKTCDEAGPGSLPRKELEHLVQRGGGKVRPGLIAEKLAFGYKQKHETHRTEAAEEKGNAGRIRNWTSSPSESHV